MKKNKTSFIENTLKDLHAASKRLKEAYVFDDEQEYPDEEMMAAGEQQADPRMMQKQVDPEATDQDLSQQDDRIARIREVALDGLQEYSEDVDSEMYQFYKKVWLMCDKAVSEKDSASNGGSSN